jgi:hypothetical protein
MSVLAEEAIFSGIYLFLFGNLAYVGMSGNVAGRIGVHAAKLEIEISRLAAIVLPNTTVVQRRFYEQFVLETLRSLGIPNFNGINSIRPGSARYKAYLKWLKSMGC